MRIIRTVLFLTGLAVLLPAPPDSPAPATVNAEAENVSGPELVFAATRTASDLGGFCLRQPGVCETAHYVARRMEAKAKYSVRLLYEWANEASGQPAPDQAAADPVTTGSTKIAQTVPPDPLTIEDLILATTPQG